LRYQPIFLVVSDVYFRLNPPLGLGNVDLVDYFHADRLEDEVEKWLATPEGRTRTGSIANKLVKQLTIETERHIEPPRLTVETVQHIEPLQMAIETEQHIEPLQLAIETEQHIKLPQLTIETARQIEPPPPPQGTNSGYNPQLDKTRPETMIEYLQ
jgi:hypothetical protein